jgi:type III secretion protein F
MASSISSGGLTIGELGNLGLNAIATQEQSLRTFASTAATSELSTGDMMKVQILVQQFTVLVNLQSTLVKDVSDALRAVIQKSN